MTTKEKTICFIVFVIISLMIIGIFKHREEKEKKLSLGYLNKLRVANLMRNDPNFNYDEFENNLNQFMIERLK